MFKHKHNHNFLLKTFCLIGRLHPVFSDDDISPVKARPPKPESRPSRPLSTPVKQ